METVYGSPLSGGLLEATRHFLNGLSLEYDDGAEFTVDLVEEDRIVATGSRQDNILKCIGVSGENREGGLAAKIVTELVRNAADSGYAHLFLFTKPKNEAVFGSLGFYHLAATEDILLMENVRSGVDRFVKALECPTRRGTVGCIVAHCDPFTNGHLYLAETAARSCDLLHFFVVSEDRGRFSPKTRFSLAKRALAEFPNIVVHPTGEYLVSFVTFPSYFIRDNTRSEELRCALDLIIFADKFAKPLNITRRFVGTEPFSPVTDRYNRAMEAFLPSRGIEVEVVPRVRAGGVEISASQVRKLLLDKEYSRLRPLVPPSVFACLEREF